MTNDSHATRENLTKCNSCYQAFCQEHTEAEIQETGWQQADSSTLFGQYGKWLCPKCRNTNDLRKRKKQAVTILHVADATTVHTNIAPDPLSQPHTWVKRHPAYKNWLRHATANDNPMCRVYTDGSAKHTQGSYGWVAGVEIGKAKRWQEIARGGGVEKVSINPARKITSARTEALGVLRATQYIQQIWSGKIEIRLTTPL